MSQSNQKLILHIGMSKTGTKSIQNTLKNNNEYFLSKGINYICYTNELKTTFAEMFSDNLNKNRFFLFNYKTKKRIDEVVLENTKRLKQVLAKNTAPTAIISIEDFSFYSDEQVAKLKDY